MMTTFSTLNHHFDCNISQGCHLLECRPTIQTIVAIHLTIKWGIGNGESNDKAIFVIFKLKLLSVHVTTRLSRFIVAYKTIKIETVANTSTDIFVQELVPVFLP